MSGGKVVGYVQMEEGTPVAFSFQHSDATGCTEPLVLQSDLAAAIARAEAAEAKLAAMEQDVREIYAQIPGLPVTPETCDAATDVLTRLCIDFNDAIAAQQAEGE